MNLTPEQEKRLEEWLMEISRHPENFEESAAAAVKVTGLFKKFLGSELQLERDRVIRAFKASLSISSALQSPSRTILSFSIP